MYVIVSPGIFSTGNLTTLSRFESHFSRSDVDLKYFSPEDFSKHKCPLYSLNRFAKANQVFGVVLIHAFKSGRVLECKCKSKCEPRFKYGVIFGGTDLNVDVNDPLKLKVMKMCLSKSKFNLCFTQSLKEKCEALLQDQRNKKTVVYPQAVDYSLFKYVDIPKLGAVLPNPVVFVLPCSIRPVKDPLLVLEWIAKLRLKFLTDIRLLIIGPMVDKSYFQTFTEEIDSVLMSPTALECYVAMQNGQRPNLSRQYDLREREGGGPKAYPSLDFPKGTDVIKQWMEDENGNFIQYIPPIDPKKFYSLMCNDVFFSFINSSVSEGMSSAILEAMAVGIPVLARGIAGNTSVIQHRKNGLIFGSERQFLHVSEFLLSNTVLRESIVRSAKSTIKKNHSPLKEAEFYFDLFEQAFMLGG